LKCTLGLNFSAASLTPETTVFGVHISRERSALKNFLPSKVPRPSCRRSHCAMSATEELMAAAPPAESALT